ncbi:hypothetical protein D3C76_1447480 [compost metagenome]
MISYVNTLKRCAGGYGNGWSRCERFFVQGFSKKEPIDLFDFNDDGHFEPRHPDRTTYERHGYLADRDPERTDLVAGLGGIRDPKERKLDPLYRYRGHIYYFDDYRSSRRRGTARRGFGFLRSKCRHHVQ